MFTNWKRLCSVVGCVLILTSPAAALAQGNHPSPTMNSQPPADVVVPGGTTGNPIAFFDDFSWREFVALNWPAKADTRGVPDTTKSFGDAADATVWESWKADYEIFQPNGQRPSIWDSFATVSPCADLDIGEAGKSKVLSWEHDAVNLAIAHFNQAGIGSPIGSLAAQNRTYVRYEVRVNEAEFNFIRGPDDTPSQHYYLKKNLPQGATARSLVFPAGSIQVKAAWREFKLPEEEDQLENYYVHETILASPDGDCQKKKMGLIGLHIVHRTPTMREWVWSTFEHVNNVTGTKRTLNNPDETQDPAHPSVNALLPIVTLKNPPQVNPNPVQVVRMRPIHASTQTTNDLYRNHPAIKDTVWANYQLIMTQWPTSPAPDDTTFQDRLSRATPRYPADAGNPFPDETTGTDTTSISNVSMETAKPIQTFLSCMNCHLPQRDDIPRTEFVWFLRQRAYDKNTKAVQAAAEQLKAATDDWLKDHASP